VARVVVAGLVARGYVDDAAFARAWAEARARGRKIGRVRLGRELAARGVAPSLVTAAIDAAFGEVGERARAREAAVRRLPALERARPERVPARLRDFLLRRGYPPAIVAETVRALVGPAGPTGDAVSDDSV
jgi:regulatory protein